MIMKKTKIYMTAIATMLAALLVCGCGSGGAQTDTGEAGKENAQTTQVPDKSPSEAVSGDDGSTEGYGDTFSGQTQAPVEEKEEESAAAEEPSDDKDVDLILFMGQSNMSGAAGDASLAPKVSEEAGMEFRAVSDPTTLYPITEPFGINENNPSGLHEYPGAKKGSLVSAFVNEYHKLTGRRVIAVSISMGATDMKVWDSPGVIADVKDRYEKAVKYLQDNGYTIGHKYALWLHGESDGMEHTDPAVYRTSLDNIIRPLFIGGLQKMFIITPGRTIDYKDIFLDIINVQKQICAESGYYAVATTILTGVSTEYMRDMFHYNQHVLNMVGIRSAQSVAYYTNNGIEMTVYDYRTGEYIIPDGTKPDQKDWEEPIDLKAINIDEEY